MFHFSNGVIFLIYNMYFIGKIDDLDTRVGPINQKGGNIYHQFNMYKTEVTDYLPTVSSRSDPNLCISSI